MSVNPLTLLDFIAEYDFRVIRVSDSKHPQYLITSKRNKVYLLEYNGTVWRLDNYARHFNNLEEVFNYFQTSFTTQASQLGFYV